jgi:Predicted membrane protein (DUF2207)
MHEGRARPPENLRPAQLGIVLLGQVILGHIAATLVDLGQRGLLRIDEVPDDNGQGWLLTDARGQAAGPGTLLPFEATLLDGLFAGQPAMRLREVSQALIPTLDRVRTQLRRDAARNGRLRRWPRGEPARRTRRGEQLLRQIHSFRQELRALAASGDTGAMEGLAPYAVLFGLSGPSAVRLDTTTILNGEPQEAEVGWSRSERFVTGWLGACVALPAVPGGHGHRSHDGRSGDFAHEWSAPHSHGHGPAQGGHGGAGYGEHGGGYGGHGGGFAGGGHGGH